MIRINLLGVPKKVARMAGPSPSMEGVKLTVMFVVVLAAGIGALGFRYLSLSSERSDLNTQLQHEEQEKVRLARVKTEYDSFQKRVQLLRRRQEIIEGLKRNQTGPVVLLSTLANTVLASDQLWLTNFEHEAGKMNIEGVADTVNTVADFISNLKRSGQFKSVEIKESYQDDKYKDLPTFVFTITAEIAPPPTAVAATTGGAPAAAKT